QHGRNPTHERHRRRTRQRRVRREPAWERAVAGHLSGQRRSAQRHLSATRRVEQAVCRDERAVMSPQVIVAESAPPTPEDERKRALVSQLLDSENGRLIDVAKQLATTCFSAVGVVLALHDKWVPAAAPPSVTTMLAGAILPYPRAGVHSLFG